MGSEQKHSVSLNDPLDLTKKHYLDNVHQVHTYKIHGFSTFAVHTDSGCAGERRRYSGSPLKCLAKSCLRLHVYFLAEKYIAVKEAGPRPKRPAVSPEESWWEVLTAISTERSLNT